MTEQKKKFEDGNCVRLKALPSVSMVVAATVPYDDRGFGGEFCVCIWFDIYNRLQTAALHADWLELSGL